MFWLRNKKNIFLLHTLNLRPDKYIYNVYLHAVETGDPSQFHEIVNELRSLLKNVSPAGNFGFGKPVIPVFFQNQQDKSCSIYLSLTLYFNFK